MVWIRLAALLGSLVKTARKLAPQIRMVSNVNTGAHVLTVDCAILLMGHALVLGIGLVKIVRNVGQT